MISEIEKIYKAKCLLCVKIYKNHRYMNRYRNNCKGNPNLNQLEISFPVISHDEYNFPTFQGNLINIFVSDNISISQIDSPHLKDIFASCGIDEELILNS